MSGARKTVLIIEDDEALVRSLSLGLQDKFQVLTALNAHDGLAKAKSEATKNKPDLILLDINLPDINGIEVLEILKKTEQTADIPVIVLTNLSDQETVSQILQAGGKEYLIKSDWTIADIGKKIEETI
ncbi:MAG: hypothetical protein A3A24_01445 [Candidatus Buchananbacteria bacterium RIFCSPLOWO2_01_FULL_46_12]|uniref:Response regulatory domain-containing protein n=2 Tax=Candidatus Buchananiibacteriota TaxID=1817903 RepID=A0A1G1YT38_9BACT|nr:MAG: hypothetical protein A2744_04520 [Candidatus Buchananbacteria bacterium RIFCSPHIGHO2_01_FULL_44_11]OGY55474.1 MAG: hypothetical protein A3A24_01445 [Candidatus Buchananbacteria bacterium RIFCSPLOWO2_01_FULL_46_12]